MAEYIDFEHVKEHGSFEAILSHYNIRYKKSGGQLRALCPFHDDTNPSLSITLVATNGAKANTFHCHGCQEDGSLLDFVADMEGTDDLRHASRLIGDVSNCTLAPVKTKSRSRRIKLPAQISQERPKREKRGTSTQEADTASTGAQAGDAGEGGANMDNPVLSFALKLDPAHPYIEERLFSNVADVFELGQCNPKSKSIMAGRICIPIHNDDGELIAYAGRYASDEVPKGVQKYLLPPKFKKLSALFNLHRLVDTSYAVIVEGYFGAMRLHSLSIPSVAIMGTLMSERQIALLEGRGIERVLLLLDADEAGRKATPTLLDLLTRSFFVKVGCLPDGEAPDTARDEVLLNLAEPVDL